MHTNRSIGKINNRLYNVRNKIGHVTVIIMDILYTYCSDSTCLLHIDIY